MLFTDLDRFKSANDQHGQVNGDKVFQTVGERIKHGLSRSDIVTRIGGDEFVAALSLPRASSAQRARQIAQRTVSNIEAPIAFSSSNAQIGASVEIALLPRNGSNASLLIAVADQAMCQVKRAGENNV